MRRLVRSVYGLRGQPAYLVLLFLVGSVPASPGSLVNGGFEDEGESWTTVGDSQAVQFSTDRAARGRRCLRLQRSDALAGWAVSAPLAELPEGPLALSLRARHISGRGRLAAAFVTGLPEHPQDIAPLWRIELPADAQWHLLRVGLVVRRREEAPLRLALGITGEEGVWQVDDVLIEQYLPPVQPGGGPGADIPPAVSPPALPPDWEPAGDLDAVRRAVGSEEELVVNVNGLDVGMAARVTVPPGIRQGLLTYVSNRGAMRKQLTVSIQGPPGTFIPEYTVPMVANRTTRFFPPIQLLRSGDWWLKVTFSSGGQSAALPIRVHCQPAYPAVGLTFERPEDGTTAPLTERLPELPAGAVLEEQVDGKLRRESNEFWDDFDRHLDFSLFSTHLNANEENLPLLLTQVGGPATGDERLDALLTTRLVINACAQGAAGVAIAMATEDLIAPGDSGSGAPPLDVALQQLTRELAAAVPLPNLADSEGFSGWQGCPVSYRVFQRADEGIVFMWNDTSAPVDVAVLLRCIPLQLHVIRLSYWGDFLTRRFQGLFSFSEEAERNRQSAVYVQVRPLEIVGLTFNLKAAHAGWLRQVAPRPPVPRRRPPRPETIFPGPTDRR